MTIQKHHDRRLFDFYDVANEKFKNNLILNLTKDVDLL